MSASSVEVRPASLPADTTKFVKTWWPIYADDPMWVPPVIFERKQFFHPDKNPFFKIADVQCFIAYRDNKPVGTIAATHDKHLVEMEPGMGMFGFFEFPNDEEVARGLLQAAKAWLKGRGLTKCRGPFNFNGNHEFGLLIDGFDTPPMISNPHNRDYYGDMYEKLGLTKTMDWFAYWIDKGPDAPPVISRIAKRFLDRNPDVTMRKMELKHFEREAELFREIYNDAWEENWGHTKYTEEEFNFTAAGLKQVINPDLCWFIYKGDEVVGAAITLPDFNQVAKKMNGRIFPFGWWHFLTGAKKIDAIRVFVLGVKRKYQNKPYGAPLYVKTWEEGSKLDIRGAECSLILEDNHRMRGALEKLGGRIYKTYRTYECEL